MVSGSEFHKVKPETAKFLCPYLVVLERGTTRSRAIFWTGYLSGSKPFTMVHAGALLADVAARWAVAQILVV